MMFGKSGRKRGRPGSAFHGGAPPSPASKKHRLLQWLVTALAFVTLVAAITKFPYADGALYDQDIDNESVAQDTIRAQFYFETENIQATEEKRIAAANAVPDRYRVNRSRVSQQLEALAQRIEALASARQELDGIIRATLMESSSADEAADLVAKSATAFATQLRERPSFQGFPEAPFLAVWLTPDTAALPERVFKPIPSAEQGTVASLLPRPVEGLEDPPVAPGGLTRFDQLASLAQDGLEFVLNQGIIARSADAAPAEQPVVIVRDNPLADQKLTEEILLRDVPGPEEAMELLKVRIVEQAKRLVKNAPQDSADWAELQEAAFEMASLGVTDTLFFDRVYTEGARELAAAAVAPVMKEIQPGEVIRRAGERWSRQSRSDFKTYQELLRTGREPAARVLGTVVAHMIFVTLVLLSLHRSLPLLFASDRKDYRLTAEDSFPYETLVLLLVCAIVIASRIISYFEPTGFIVPVTAIAVLLAILVQARLATITSFLTAALVSIQYNYDWRLLVVACAMSLTSVFSIYIVRRRTDMTRAAVNATIVGLLTMFAITLATDALFSQVALHRFALVAMNGGLCLLIVPGLLAPLERLFGITTDIQLLEYSDLNNEVLSRLAIEVPATYAHGLMLGQIAEAAADAIGANGLLARVCAYYHDIGKLRRPEYFSENQTGTNIHDGLSPRLSARAIAAHVTQGIELAREYHLPKPIIDAIREHHGTTLISFFYQQALEQQKHGGIREEDFRYSGPKPQRRETAILMICDAVESGVRSIKNPNEERVREFIDRIISARAADHQFDECHLTLKDLNTIAQVITRRMLTTAHTRIAYPDMSRGQQSAPNVIRLSGGPE